MRFEHETGVPMLQRERRRYERDLDAVLLHDVVEPSLEEAVAEVLSVD